MGPGKKTFWGLEKSWKLSLRAITHNDSDEWKPLKGLWCHWSSFTPKATSLFNMGVKINASGDSKCNGSHCLYKYVARERLLTIHAGRLLTVNRLPATPLPCELASRLPLKEILSLAKISTEHSLKEPVGFINELTGVFLSYRNNPMHVLCTLVIHWFDITMWIFNSRLLTPKNWFLKKGNLVYMSQT